MEQNLSNLIRPMSVVANEAVQYIAGRREHKIVSLKTRWNKFNKQCMGGIEPNTVLTIAGISGSGKSSFANLITTDVIDLNESEDIIVLNFSLVKDIIFQFYDTYVKGTNKHFLIVYDHALLTKQVGSVLETISELERVFIQAKKLPMTSIIQLAQMNRNIESSERINNPTSHYPMRSDLSSSDAIFQASDYVCVIHRPEIFGIQEYGPNHLPTSNKVYIHMLKNRDAGKPCILEFENDLAFNNLIEV